MWVYLITNRILTYLLKWAYEKKFCYDVGMLPDGHCAGHASRGVRAGTRRCAVDRFCRQAWRSIAKGEHNVAWTNFSQWHRCFQKRYRLYGGTDARREGHGFARTRGVSAGDSCRCRRGCADHYQPFYAEPSVGTCDSALRRHSSASEC